MVCTFFGHKDTPKEIEPTLRSTLIDLIENKNVRETRHPQRHPAHLTLPRLLIMRISQSLFPA